MIDFDIDAEDVEHQAQLLAHFDAIATRRFRPVTEWGLGQVVAGFHMEAPVGEGVYVGSIGGVIDHVIGIEVKAVASATARRDSGFPYPAALETSARYRFQATGRLSRGTMRRMLKSKGEALMNRFWQALETTMNDLVVP